MESMFHCFFGFVFGILGLFLLLDSTWTARRWRSLGLKWGGR